MKIKKLLAENTILVFKYINRFGYRGIIFLFKSYFKKNNAVLFSHKKYSQPIILRNNTSDILTFHHVICDQDYNIDYGFEPKIIVDCGANIGLATVYFKNRFPNAKIIAIEPEQSNYEMLLQNTKNYNDIHCLKNGIWNRPANLIIKDVGLGSWGFMIEEIDNCQKDSISAITINDIMKKFNLDHIDILKIDIEGSEKEVFGDNYEEWLSKIKVLIIELHDRYRSGSSKSVFKALSNYNFSMIYFGENMFCFFK